MLRTIAVSSGCTRMFGACDTTIPLLVTTSSTGIRPMIAIREKTMLATIQVIRRAERGIGALTIAVEGHWNSSTTGRAASRRGARVRASGSTLEEVRLIARLRGHAALREPFFFSAWRF